MRKDRLELELKAIVQNKVSILLKDLKKEFEEYGMPFTDIVFSYKVDYYCNKEKEDDNLNTDDKD